MYNFNKKSYLPIILTIYVFGLMIGCIVQNMYFHILFTFILMIAGIWSTCGEKKSEHVQQHRVKHVKIKSEKVGDEHVKKSKHNQPQPNINSVYMGEEITEDDLKKIKHENRSWFSNMNTRIGNTISDIKSQYMEKEEKEHGNKG